MGKQETAPLGGAARITLLVCGDDTLLRIEVSPSSLALTADEVEDLIEALQAQRLEMNE